MIVWESNSVLVVAWDKVLIVAAVESGMVVVLE